jgi:hypothetical protein
VVRPTPPADDELDDALAPRYSLTEAHQKGILPWKAATARTYRKRSIERGIPVPEGESDGQTTRYTEDELRTWRAAWERNTVPAVGMHRKPDTASR